MCEKQPNLNFGLILNISFIYVFRGLGTSPNILRCGKLSFPTISIALRPKSNFETLSRLYVVLELPNLFHWIPQE